MKKIIAICALALFIFACSGKKQGNMIVQGQIKGLKKGTLYLQKMKDTALVSVDSITLLGDDKFTLSDNIEDPIMYYLTFEGNKTDKRIVFFGEKGNITINDKIEEFGFKPKISGSKNQELWEKFNVINKKFRDQRLVFIKDDFDAKKNNDTELIKKLEVDYKRMMKRRFLYATNFALTNADNEVAPYIAITELFDANIKLLDTINKSMSDKVKNSTYGKHLQKYVADIKKNEQK